MKDTMTTRERWNAAIRMQPVDRLAFWPKLNGSAIRAHGPKLNTKDISEIHRHIGSECFAGLGGGVKCTRPNTELRSKDEGGGRTSREYVTPLGTLHAANQHDEASCSGHPVEFPIKRPEDLKTMTAWFADAQYEVDPEAVQKVQEREKAIGQSACTIGGVGISPLMDFLQHLAGIENAHYFLMDCQDSVEELFDAMHQNNLRSARLNAEVCPADCFFLTENTSTSLTSPDQYRKYCQKHVTDYIEVLHEHGRMAVIHMCGFLKDILPDIRQAGAEAFEAFTSPPVGNTRFLDGRTACPDTCLLGGTNAALWLLPANRIIEELGRDLDALPHTRGIIPSSGGVMPPAASLETIKAVCDFVRTYPVRN